MTGVVPQGRESLALTLAAGIESLGLGLAEVQQQQLQLLSSLYTLALLVHQ